MIAIIAILAAILFPVFAQAKAAAKDTPTLSGAKQTALAVLMYTNDYDDTMPLPMGNDYYNDPTTLEVLYPYVKNINLFWDVSGGVWNGPKPMVDDGVDGLLYGWGWWDWNITISMNDNAAHWWNGTADVQRTTSSQQFPSELCDLAVIRAPGYNDDTIGAPQWDGPAAMCSQLPGDNIGSDTYANYWNGMIALGASRHNGKIIASFMDGHAGHKQSNAMVLQNCTQYSSAYWNWYGQPSVAHFFGEYWDGTQ